jgi:hypothetical protein
MNPVRTIIETDCTTHGITIRGPLLKRMANASHGHPDQELWFLHLREPAAGEYDVEPFLTCNSAMDARKGKDNPDDYTIFGPVLTTKRDIIGAPHKAMPDAAVAKPHVPIETPLQYVLLIFDDAKKAPVLLDAKKHDALFWGISSVTKFAVPYYVAASTLGYGVKVHETFYGTTLQGRPVSEPAYALVHEPDTDYRTIHTLPERGQTPGGTADPKELPL